MTARVSSSRLADCICLLRGGGDLATGVAWRLHRAGFIVVVTELRRPLTVRRSVSLSSAVTEGEAVVEGMIGRRCETVAEALEVAATGAVPVLVSPGLPAIDASVVVDARLAKRNIDTTPADAPFVIGLGPGFVAPDDCHAVIETQRGPRLGRVIHEGSAAPNTGIPGVTGGRGAERVLRADVAGPVHWRVAIGDQVTAGEAIGSVADQLVIAPFAGMVRGLILDGHPVSEGLKIGDIDPRIDVACDEISDKALAVGGGVLEAALWWWSNRP